MAPTGTLANEQLYRDDDARLEVVAQGRPWSLSGDEALSPVSCFDENLELRGFA